MGFLKLPHITDVLSSSRNKAYVYDKLGRLKEAKGGSDAFFNPSWTQSYTYDRYGNRTSVSKSGSGASSIPLDGLASLAYTNAQSQTVSNRITTAGYEYDPAGNQTRGQTENGTWRRYKYDSAGRLAVALDDGGNPLETYSYGASNERLMTVYGNGLGAPATYYCWEGGQVIADFRAGTSNNLVWEKSYVYLGGRLLATADISGTKYHHPDRLGTRLITDTSGNVTTEQVNLPYGTALTTESSGAISNRRFTSYDRSATTGMDYAVNRFYNSAQGRFTKTDPIGMSAASLADPQSLNLYSYCGNDPVNRLDPDGLFWGKLFGWVGKVFKAVAIAVFVAGAILLTAGLAAAAIAGSWAAGGAFFQAFGALMGFFMQHKTIAGILGIGSVGGFHTPGINGSGVSGVSRFLAQDPVHIPEEYLDIVSEQWSVLSNGQVVYEMTMNVTACISWNCVFRAIGKGVKIGTKKAWNNVFGSPKAVIGAILTSRVRIRNPFGKKGGPAHQQKVDDLVSDIEKRNLKAEREAMIETAGGKKRYVDVVGRDPATGDIIEMHQVGKQTKKGIPVARERRALDDIEAAVGTRPTFHPYNKP